MADTSVNNSTLRDNSKNQKLTQDDILNMRKEKVREEDIVEALVANSETFESKTEFSRAKYIKKKQQKHMHVVTLLKPTSFTLANAYFHRDAYNINFLRPDTLGRILYNANVKSGDKVLLLCQSKGLIPGAIIERLGGSGILAHVYETKSPATSALKMFHFSEREKQSVVQLPLRVVRDIALDNQLPDWPLPLRFSPFSLPILFPDSISPKLLPRPPHPQPSSEPQQPSSEPQIQPESQIKLESEASEVMMKEATTEESKGKDRDLHSDDSQDLVPHLDLHLFSQIKSLFSSGFDSLIIASKSDPLPLLISLFPYLKPSGSIVIYYPSVQELGVCFDVLKESYQGINLSLSETWLREFQVLEARTRPNMKMNGASGYLLVATKTNYGKDLKEMYHNIKDGGRNNKRNNNTSTNSPTRTNRNNNNNSSGTGDQPKNNKSGGVGGKRKRETEDGDTLISQSN
eukprot:CAMPEP_0174258544 /NCGR_PEP_ID=MMETSP0439-20130205/7518_1 /TAXON_ID=0 /ORGANISM="Stereomyxa ramosa, Strain Chinc5" /LENGTH=459 /DNA_ID=CAMNT_0015342085 /DNA_START=147 /DNA_END=1526 /DNA_ORIENTATION=-